MEDNKSWWQSRAVWGGLIAVGAAVAGAFGIDVDAETQNQIAEYVVVGASAIGGLLAIFGRIKASKKISN